MSKVKNEISEIGEDGSMRGRFVQVKPYKPDADYIDLLAKCGVQHIG